LLEGFRRSNGNWHRCDDWRGDLLTVPWHDDDPQRPDTSAASSESGSIFGCHRQVGSSRSKVFTMASDQPGTQRPIIERSVASVCDELDRAAKLAVMAHATTP
jgi:hypothetical protein